MQYNLTEPVFVKKGAIGLNAIEKWKRKTYLKSKFNNVIVDVEIYESEKDMERSRSKIKQVEFNDYVDNLHSGWYLPDCGLGGLDINEDIYEDIFNPDRPEMPRDVFLFLGRDTKTGAHIHVEEDFVINQIVGKKIVYLLDFEELTLNNIFSRYSNFSKENFFQLDGVKQNIQRIEMDPGDMLFIPPWTWHATENIGNCISVTKIFSREQSYFKEKRFKSLKRRHQLEFLYNYFRRFYYKNY